MQRNRLLHKLIVTTMLLNFIPVVSAQQATLSEHIQQLNHKDVSVRLYGTYVLGAIGDAQAVQPLIKLLKDADIYVRAAAIDALGEIGDTAALAALTGLLQDESHMIREHAANAVSKIAPQQEKEYQIRRYMKDLSDPNHRVRAQALAALVTLQPNEASTYRQSLAIADLADADPSIRATGAATLGEVGDEGAVTPLIHALDDSSPLVRGNAAMALGQIASRSGSDALQAAVDALAGRLGDRAHHVRTAAGRSLVQIGVAAVQPLISALSMPDGKINPVALNALGQIGEPAVKGLSPLLEGDNASIRAAAAEVLSQIQPDKAQIYQARRSMKDLSDSDASIRTQAATRLGRIGHVADVGPLVAALADEDSRVRQSASIAIGQIGEPAISAVIPLLSDGNPSVRWHAIMALGWIASKLEANARLQPAIDPLLTALKDSDASIRAVAAETLKRIGISASEKIKTLLTDEDAGTRAIAATLLVEMQPDMAHAYQRARYTVDLQDDDPAIRIAAASALGTIGNADAAGHLVALLKSQNSMVRQHAATALVQLGESAINALITVLRDENPLARRTAMVTLGEIAQNMEYTTAMQPTIEPLVDGLKDTDSSIRLTAIEALAKVGRPAADTLINLLGDRDSLVRSAATRALSQMGDAVTGSLIAALSNPKSGVRQNAATALGMISPDEADQYQVTRYINDLKDTNPIIRARAAKMLGLMGGTRAIEPLITALADADYRVRLRASEALGALGDKRAISALDAVKKDDVDAVEEAAKDAQDRLKRLP